MSYALCYSGRSADPASNSLCHVSPCGGGDTNNTNTLRRSVSVVSVTPQVGRRGDRAAPGREVDLAGWFVAMAQGF